VKNGNEQNWCYSRKIIRKTISKIAGVSMAYMGKGI
jgi:hypothetical protein